jgi:hypothetical protein
VLRAWLDAVDLGAPSRQPASPAHSTSAWEHERRLQRAVATAVAEPSQLAAAATEVFTAYVAAIP